MYDVCHPSYYKICELGCKDDVKITTAFHVYIELCEDRKLWDVEYKYEPSLDLVYLEAKKTKDSEPEIYVPWAAKYAIKIEDMENIQKTLDIERFTLVSKGGDGTSMFHTINSGLTKPLAPQEHNEIRLLCRKRTELSRELRKNSRNLYDMAKLKAEEPQDQAEID
ncbi:uncharacterized protein LOC107046107 [Diachasma alloeum]|uniref:uncharacterized protein LOC107046107 n=1 Tax=Diachasma alloeum TaxID=454923 RepID=UPI00073813E0|nr:uncharacterized protein LOC107046107 [Diachasma alloeum]